MKITKDNILFLWFLLFGTILTVIAIYKWAFPLIKIEKVVAEKPVYVGKYEVRPVSNIGTLVNGDIVKWGSINMCVSSIATSDLKKYNPSGDPPVVIYLRPVGDCK